MIASGGRNGGSVYLSLEDDGAYQARGQQQVGKDNLTIEGRIVPNGPTELHLIGDIVVTLDGFNNNQPCQRTGTGAAPLIFVLDDSERYWRLADRQSPCGPIEERIDIYATGL